MNKRNIIFGLGASSWLSPGMRPGRSCCLSTRPLARNFPAGPMASIDKETMVLTKGNFKGLAHETEGLERYIDSPTAGGTLRLTEFATSNGPDVHASSRGGGGKRQ